MDWKLEVVPVPVTDVDRAKHFYGKQVGFAVDHDTTVSDTMRVAQLIERDGSRVERLRAPRDRGLSTWIMVFGGLGWLRTN